MFLKYTKDFILKKGLKKSLLDVKKETLESAITKVGLIVDETKFKETELLKQEIVSNGIATNKIKTLVFSNEKKRNETVLNSVFGYKDLSFKGEFRELSSVKVFLEQKFDLLINYYDNQEPILMFVTNNAKSKFKIGFSSVDKRLNHLFINIGLEDYRGFTHELFRYLKILNKI